MLQPHGASRESNAAHVVCHKWSIILVKWPYYSEHQKAGDLGGVPDARAVNLAEKGSKDQSMEPLTGRFAPWLNEFARVAQANTPTEVFDWLMGGAGKEQALEGAPRAWASLQLVPDAGIDVTRVSSTAHLLGQDYRAPT